MLYGKNTSLEVENVKSNLLSKENIDVDCHSESERVKGLLFEVELNKRTIQINLN
jgi:hypothetical protein